MIATTTNSSPNDNNYLPNQTQNPATYDKLTPPLQHIYLSKSTHLTRKEVIRRRLHRLKHLSKCYRAHYWMLMEELRVRYRDYCWKFGNCEFEKGRVKKDKNVVVENQFGVEGCGENNDEGSFDQVNFAELVGCKGNVNNGVDVNFKMCVYVGCKSKAMALTSFCHLHILADVNQKLYKPCYSCHQECTGRSYNLRKANTEIHYTINLSSTPSKDSPAEYKTHQTN